MSAQTPQMLTAGFEKEIIKKAVEKIYAVYSSGTSDSPGGNEYPCTRVLNRLYWYRRKAIRCKCGYHLLSILVVIMPLAATVIKTIKGVHTPLQLLDYAEITLTSLTSILAFILGHFRFLEKWKRYRKILERSIHICSDRLIDDTQVTYETAVALLHELENIFKEDTNDWTPDPNEKKQRCDHDVSI